MQADTNMKENMGNQTMSALIARRVFSSRRTLQCILMFILGRADLDAQIVPTFKIQKLLWIPTIWCIKIRSISVRNAQHFQLIPLLIYFSTKEENM